MTINMSDARRMIIAAYKADEPLLLIGKPGMGKTAMFESVARELGIAHIDFRLSLRDPVEVGGMRIPDQSSGVLKHFPPGDLPDTKRHGRKGIVVFDEINVVSQMLQATAYGIIQERRCGAYKMPQGWVPMAAGNNVSDRAAAQRISTALANRFNVQVVEPDLQSWLNQYGREHVDARGTAFLRFRPELFHVMPKGEELAFPTPRSWTKAFKFITEEPSFRRKIIAGFVGKDAADEFEAFWRIMEKAPSLDDILASPKTAPIPEERDAGTYYAVAGMVARALNVQNAGKLMIYVRRLMPDYQASIVIDATRRDKTLKETRAYTSWLEDHQEVAL